MSQIQKYNLEKDYSLFLYEICRPLGKTGSNFFKKLQIYGASSEVPEAVHLENKMMVVFRDQWRAHEDSLEIDKNNHVYKKNCKRKNRVGVQRKGEQKAVIFFVPERQGRGQIRWVIRAL